MTRPAPLRSTLARRPRALAFGRSVRRAVALAATTTALVAPALLAQEGLAVGSRPPASAPLETLDGKPADLSQFIGKSAVLFEFWASWCPNCRQLEPQIAALAKRYAGKLQVVTVAVSVNQPVAMVQKHLAKHPLAGVVLYDRKGLASEAYDAPATSYVVIVNAKGVVVYTGSGGAQKLAPAVAKAF